MNKKQLKRFFTGCRRSLMDSYNLPLPAFPHKDMNFDKWRRNRWWVFLMPWKYMCVRANWRIAKKIYGEK